MLQTERCTVCSCVFHGVCYPLYARYSCLQHNIQTWQENDHTYSPQTTINQHTPQSCPQHCWRPANVRVMVADSIYNNYTPVFSTEHTNVSLTMIKSVSTTVRRCTPLTSFCHSSYHSRGTCIWQSPKNPPKLHLHTRKHRLNGELNCVRHARRAWDIIVHGVQRDVPSLARWGQSAILWRSAGGPWPVNLGPHVPHAVSGVRIERQQEPQFHSGGGHIKGGTQPLVCSPQKPRRVSVLAQVGTGKCPDAWQHSAALPFIKLHRHQPPWPRSCGALHAPHAKKI